MNEFKVGDLLVCLGGPEEDIPTLGYITEIFKNSAKRYKVHWIDDDDDVDMYYEHGTIGVFHGLLMEMMNEGKV